MAGLFDTHAHVQIRDFDADRDETLDRARDAGVTTILNVGFSLDTSRKAIRLAERHDDCYATVGLHPHDARDWSSALRDELAKLAEHPKVVAVGEAGLDYYRDLSPRDRQAEAFLGQIALARETNLPLIIHNRDATDDLLRILESDAEGVSCLLHCFSADWAAAERALALGCCFGIGGPVTYPKSEALREVVRRLPADRFVIETDAPWLAPQPKRGKRNEPAYVRATAERTADVRRISIEDVAAQTTANARAFFRLDGGRRRLG
ncbi:TatD family deoxyribonuclease [Candidatus Poribacteria bacterium]|nr:TatD family deoxyribonuclease [Candidatus Poribacteria bacterium]